MTRKRAFCLTDGFEWVLGSWVHEQFILAPFVIAIGQGLDGGYWFLYGGWWLGVDSLLGVRLADSSMQIAINKCMRIFELEKPKTPEQLRLDQLRATSKRASDALKIERDRQKAQRAQKALQSLRSPDLKTPI